MKVMIIRSTDMNPTPRVDKSALYIQDLPDCHIRIVGWNRGGDAASNERRAANVEVIRKSGAAQYGVGAANALKLLRYQAYVFYQLLRYSPDVVQAVDFDVIIPAFTYCRLFGKKVIFDIADMYAASRKLTGWAFKTVNYLESFLAAYSDAVLIPDVRRLQQYPFFNKRIARKLVEISNTPYEVSPEQLAQNDMPAADIVYVGILSAERYVVELCDWAARSGWRLVVGGYGVLEKEIIQYAQKYSNITFLGKLPYDKCLRAQKRGRFIWAVYNTSDATAANNVFASPNRLYEALMLGVPLIVGKGSMVDELVAANNFGKVLTFKNFRDAEPQLNELLAQPDNFAIDKMRELYQQKYAFSIMKERLRAVYCRCGKRRTNA